MANMEGLLAAGVLTDSVNGSSTTLPVISLLGASRLNGVLAEMNSDYRNSSDGLAMAPPGRERCVACHTERHSLTKRKVAGKKSGEEDEMDQEVGQAQGGS